jgi:mycothiol synthase
MTSEWAGGPIVVTGAPAIAGLRFRRIDRERDFPAIAEVIAAADVHDGVEWIPSAEALRHDWEGSQGMDLDEDVLVAEIDGSMIGFVDHSWRVRGECVFHQLEPVVRPEHRCRGIGGALLRWAEARVAAGLAAGDLGASTGLPHVLAGWADLEVAATVSFAAGAGYVVDGYSILMTRSLADLIPDLALPDGLEVRPVRPEDHRRIWDADTEAFQDHRDPAVRTDADYERWFSQPDLNTSRWVVAWDGAEVAGSSMNFVWPEENERLGLRRGWLEHVSVRRPWRRRGLGSALIARSLAVLRDLGLAEAALGADAENLTGAVRIYEALGFRRRRTGAGYRKPIEVPAGPALGAVPADVVDMDLNSH